MGKVKNAYERVGSDLLQGHVAPLTEKGSDLCCLLGLPCLNFFFLFFFQVLNVYLF